MAGQAITWDATGRAYGDLFDKQYALNVSELNLPTVPRGSIKQVILPYYTTRAILTYHITFANENDLLVYRSNGTGVVKKITQNSRIDDLGGGLGHGIIRLTGYGSDNERINTTWLAETIHFPS